MKNASLIQLCIAILILLGVLGGYAWWYGKVSALSAKAAGLAGEVSAKNDDVARVAAAKTVLATLSGDEEQVTDYFVSSDSIVSFLEELQQTGKAFGAKVDVASVSADLKSAAPHLSLSLRIDGSFEAVMRTLGVIEFSARDITVNDLTLAGAVGTDASHWTATAMFTVGAREGKPAAAKAAPAPAATSTATTTP